MARPRFPESRIVSVAEGYAAPIERDRLGLAEGARVLRIARVRSLDGRPCIAETVTLPAALFPGLGDAEIPNNLYATYASRYGITVARAREQLKAVALDGSDAALLGVAPGHPALLIDREAIALDGVPVEWRVSRCLTEDFHYISDLK